MGSITGIRVERITGLVAKERDASEEAIRTVHGEDEKGLTKALAVQRRGSFERF